MYAKQNTWQKVFKPKKPKWPDPQISVGQFYRAMGDLSCWEATGLAREAFSRVAEEIREYLEKYSDPVSDEVTWTMYMIGKTKETSEPTIMFCGRDTKCRKYIKKTVKESGILERHAGVRLGDAPQPPDFDQLVQLAGFSYQEFNEMPGYLDGDGRELYTNRVAFGSKTGHISGKKLCIPFHDNEHNIVSIRYATGGGIVYAANRYFYLTAGHAFENENNPSRPGESAGSEDYDFDLSEADDSEDDKSFVDTTSRGSITPDIDDSISSDDSTPSSNIQPHSVELDHGSSLATSSLEGQLSDVASGKSTEKLEQLLGGLVAVGRLLQKPSTTSGRIEIDYSLVETFPHVTASLLEDDTTPKLHLSGDVMIKPTDTAIASITASAGLIRGTLSGTPTYQIMPGAQSTRELWTVRLTGTLSEGDCGSWVVDEESGDLVGHVVAGSPQSGIAYIVPACHVFVDAKKKFDVELKPLLTPGSASRSTKGASPLELTTQSQVDKSSSQMSTEQLHKEWENYPRQMSEGSTATSILLPPITDGASQVSLGLSDEQAALFNRTFLGDGNDDNEGSKGSKTQENHRIRYEKRARKAVETDSGDRFYDSDDISVFSNPPSLSGSHTSSAPKRDTTSQVVEGIVDLSQSIFIAVVGPPGAGKNDFVNRFSHDSSNTSSSQNLHTNRVNVASFKLSRFLPDNFISAFSSSTTVYLIDIPAFVDDDESDIETFKNVAAFLTKSYLNHVKLTGMIYLHPITSSRMTSGRNLQMLKHLCGEEALKSSLLVTTMWSEINKEDISIAEARKTNLSLLPEFGGWTKMTLLSHPNDMFSLMDIISNLLDKRDCVTLQIQDEMVNDKFDLNRTSAGSALRQEVWRHLDSHQTDKRFMLFENLRSLHVNMKDLHRMKYPDLEKSMDYTSEKVLDEPSLVQAVAMQLEYYFSIDNLCKDVYLRKHMDSRGFVLMSFIAGFKHIRALTDDFDLLRYICQESDIIDVIQGEDGKDRVRRAEGWEKWVMPMKDRDESVRNTGPYERNRRLQRPPAFSGSSSLSPLVTSSTTDISDARLRKKSRKMEKETALPSDKKEPIRFKDAIGRKFSFPFHLCSTWIDMKMLIKSAFPNVEVIDQKVQEGYYDLVGPNFEIILPDAWESTVEPGWAITMLMWPLSSSPKTRLAFSQPNDMATRGATRRVTCPVMGCNQTFSRQYDCNRHEDEVHGDPKLCPIPGCAWQNSKRKGRLDAHMKKKHKELYYNMPLEVPASQRYSSQLATSTYDGQASYAQTTSASTTIYSNEQPAQTAITYDQAPQYYQPIIQTNTYTAENHLEVGNENASTIAETSNIATDEQVEYNPITDPSNQQYRDNYFW